MPLHVWKNPRVAWKSFHNFWVVQIAEYLNEVLPPGFQARPTELIVGIEPDVLLTQQADHPETAFPLKPQPGLMQATRTMVLPPPMEKPFVGVYSDYDASRLVAAIELVSPSNKESPVEAQAFIEKALLFLRDGVHFMVIDVISDPARSIRRPLLERLGLEASTTENPLGASSYCSLPAEEPQPHITIREWAHDLAVGQPLPTLPLFLRRDELWVMVDLESTYQETIRAGRYKPS